MDQHPWRWIEYGIYRARHNMAVDGALLEDCGRGRIPPSVRLYGWSEPAITVGYSQRYESELDVERCRAEGIDIVRRPTGGRALLHHRELSYAVVAPVSLAPFDQGLKATFNAVSEALLAGLGKLGIRGVLNKSRHPAPAGPRRSPACFAALNHCEITVDGKKLVGSAQRRNPQAFLQHGSIILEPDHERFVSLLAFEQEEDRRSLLRHLQDSTESLAGVCGSPPDVREIVRALKAGFMETFAGPWVEEESPDTLYSGMHHETSR